MGLLQNYDFADRNESSNESRKSTADSHQLHDRYNVLLICRSTTACASRPALGAYHHP